MTAEEPSDGAGLRGALAPYVPSLIARGDGDPGARLVMTHGTLVSADISGFTALSERLAGFGREGAEELTDLLNRCFTGMIEVCDRTGGEIVKFGGDALLILFDGRSHAERACTAMAGMRLVVAQPWSTPSVARVPLGISQGAHTGDFAFALVDGGHLELVPFGPGVSRTIGCESNAGKGEILVSSSTAMAVDRDWLGVARSDGSAPLRHRRIPTDADFPEAAQARPKVLTPFVPTALIEQIAVRGPGEHRQVAIGFVAFADSDELYLHEGPAAVHEALGGIAAHVADIVDRYPVHWLASDAYDDGGKIILTAGAPLSSGRDEDALLLAVVDLLGRDARLPLRAGLNRGPVFVGDLGSPTRRTFTVMGDAVNLAARLMQKAEAGQAVASRHLLDRATTHFSTAALPPFNVKGKVEPIEAAIVERVHDNEGEAETRRHLSAVPFVGRAAEIALLQERLATARDGQGRVIELIGEAGLGKSRLIRELLDRNPDVRGLTLRGGQYARNTPYFVARRLLRTLADSSPNQTPEDLGAELTAWVDRTAPHLAEWLPLIAIAYGADLPMTPAVERLARQFRRDRLIGAVGELIEASLPMPTIIVAEDCDWFDEASFDVLRELGRRAIRRAWLILATGRPDAPRLVDDPADADVVELQPLNDAETLELAATAADFGAIALKPDGVDQLADRAGGHPLFVLELLAGAGVGTEDDVPDSIESLVTTRIDTLAAADRMRLREAAVSGAVVYTQMMAAATDDPDFARPEPWERLSDFLARERPGVYRFRHSLYREVAYAGLSYRRRREMHRRLGEAMEQVTETATVDIEPLLALHFDRARVPHKAWRYSVAAGDDARGAYANAEAAGLYARALTNAVSAEAPAEAVARVGEALGDVLELSGRYDEAFDAYQRTRKAPPPDPIDSIRLHRKIGQLRLREGNFSQSLRWYTRALRATERLDDEPAVRRERAELALARAGTHHRQGRNTECVRWAEQAADDAAASGDRLTEARVQNILEVAHRTLGHPEAPEHGRRALELYEGSGDLVGEANVLNNLGIAAYFSGDWDAARCYYEQAQTRRRQAGDVVGEAFQANNLAELLSLQGRFDEARGLFESARRTWQAANHPLGVAHVTVNLSMVEARAGDVGLSESLLDDARRQFRELGAAGLLVETDVRQVEQLLLSGRSADACDVADRLDAILRGTDAADDVLLLELAPLRGLALVRTGRLDEAADQLDSAVSMAVTSSNRYAEALCRLGRAELARRSDDDPADELARADELLAALDVKGYPPVAGVRPA